MHFEGITHEFRQRFAFNRKSFGFGILDSDMIQLLYLALIFDFMAFTAQTFRRVLKREPSTPANLQAIRDTMVENISTMKAHYDNDTFSVTADILRAIVLDSELTPSERSPHRRGDPLFSPPPTRDDITPSKYTHYETHTEEATSPAARIPQTSSTSASPSEAESPAGASPSPHPTVTFALVIT
jgi:hypothetical protein